MYLRSLFLPFILFLALAITSKSRLTPRQNCDNSGYGNTGCANSGIDNTGIANSGISNCGIGLSGVSEGCNGTAHPATFTVTSVLPTATVTTAADDDGQRRTDCAYWRSQGYACSSAAGVAAGWSAVLAAFMATGGLVVVWV